MRNPLHGLRSVGAKVIGIVVLVSGIAVIAVSVSSAVRDYSNSKQQRIEAITSQSLIVAVNSGAPLVFRDLEMAVDAISALRVVEGVEQVTLVDAERRAFARFAAPGVASTPPTLLPIGHWQRGDSYVLVVPVTDRAGVHGRLEVVYSGLRLRNEARAIAAQTLLLSLLAMLLAWLLARRLHPVLTAPILELERSTQRVRDTGDYGVRATRSSDDELGRLTDAFNGMLGQIQANEAALLQAQRRAEEASRLKDEFVATLSHELRTPLSPILGWIQMLRRPAARVDLDTGLEVMERNARALIRLIDDLLDMSRIVSGTLRLDAQPVDLNAIIEAATETLAPAAQSRQLRVRLQLQPSPPLRGDPLRLQQVMWNLLSNAIKFSEPGGNVTVGSFIVPGRVDIVVTDTGIGIEPEFIPFVFDRFRQQDGSTTRLHGGLGLGLAIVRQLVELHGGTVRVESRGLGEGSTFTVSLPLATGRPAATAAPADDALAPRLDGVAVLVVEDDADMAEVIRRALHGAGATVRLAADAATAMRLFAADRVDVLVSDIGLPDTDGYQLLGQVRLQPAGRTLPAVALTAYALPEERQRALDAGFQWHLTKPVSPDALVAAVARAVAGGAVLS